jgi:hypothetical protein
MFFVLFLLACGSMIFIFEMPWRQLFFFAIVSYTAQHFSYQIYSIFGLLTGLTSSLGNSYSSDIFTSTDAVIIFLQMLSTFVIYSMSYTTIYIVFISKILKSDFKFKYSQILFISAIILLIDIIINAVVVYNAKDLSLLIQIIFCISSVANCFVVFFLLYYVLDVRKLTNDLDVNAILLRDAEEKYRQMKDNVDLINVKCHDLKHQIRTLGTKSNLSNDTINDMENAIQIYDSNMHTGNNALDLILVEKKLSCQKFNINLKCYADGSKLNFMSDSDLYSLFGNAIDNAVEAVAKIDNPEKRTVNVIVKNTNHFISVMVENYYKGSLKYNSDGLPITTKENNGYHGFGVKSIKIIVDKYQGTCNIRTNNGIFSLAITFPEKEQSMAD